MTQILAKQWEVNLSAIGPAEDDVAGARQVPSSNTVGTNAADQKNKAAFLKERKLVFGEEQLAARDELAELLRCKPLLLDHIIGMSQNNPRAIEPTMKNLVKVPQAQIPLIEALLYLYNGNDSKLPDNVEYIETYLETRFGENSPIPHGLLRALFGSLRGFTEELCKGITQGFSNIGNTWNPQLPIVLHKAVPICFAYIHSPETCALYLTEDEILAGRHHVWNKILGI